AVFSKRSATGFFPEALACFAFFRDSCALAFEEAPGSSFLVSVEEGFSSAEAVQGAALSSALHSVDVSDGGAAEGGALSSADATAEKKETEKVTNRQSQRPLRGGGRQFTAPTKPRGRGTGQG